MKHMRRLVLRYWASRMISALIVLLILTGCAKQTGNSEIIDVYDFPVKPGSQEWAAFTSHDEMSKICQIPEALLSKMSTKGLVETVLNYPLYGDMLAYNSIQKGFDAVVSGFNGLQELLKREDAGTMLLAKYHALNPAAIDKSWSLEQQGKLAMDFMYIEMLLSQDAILANLTEVELRDLLAEAMVKAQAKQQYAEIYGQFSQERTALLMGRVLRHTNYGNFRQKMQEDTMLSTFVNDGTIATGTALEEIFLQTQQFLSK
jgi:hypothetical protein